MTPQHIMADELAMRCVAKKKAVWRELSPALSQILGGVSRRPRVAGSPRREFFLSHFQGTLGWCEQVDSVLDALGKRIEQPLWSGVNSAARIEGFEGPEEGS